jgi:hypothetical protein
MRNKALIIIAGLLFTGNIIAQEAAQWRGKDRDGIYSETGLLRSWPVAGPKLLWHNDNILPEQQAEKVLFLPLLSTENLHGTLLTVKSLLRVSPEPAQHR